METKNEVSLLSEFEVFKGVSIEDLAWLHHYIYIKSVPPGTQILIEGMPGEVVYFIKSGTIKITKTLGDGSELILDFIGGGDILGEMSIVDLAVRSANAITIEETTLIWMSRTIFERCLNETPTVAKNLLSIMSKRLRKAHQQIQTLATLDIYGRVARILFNLMEIYGVNVKDSEDIIIPLRLTQGDIAGLVLGSRERVNQAMVSMKRMDYISVDENYHITIHNRKALEEICDPHS